MKLWNWIKDLFSPMCYKESLGYRCQHRINSNGTKECD